MALFSKNASQGTSETKWLLQLWLTNQVRIFFLSGTSSGRSLIYNRFFSLVRGHSFVLPMGGYISEKNIEAQGPCCSCSQLSNRASCSKRLIHVLTDAGSAHLSLLTIEGTREFHVPKLGYLVRCANVRPKMCSTHLVVCAAKFHIVPMTQGHPFSHMLPSSHRGSTVAGTDVGQVITDCRKALYWLSLTVKLHPSFPRMSMVQLSFPLAWSCPASMW